MRMTVPVEQYESRFVDSHMAMKAETIVKVQEVGKSFCEVRDFQMTNDASAVTIEVNTRRLVKGRLFFL